MKKIIFTLLVLTGCTAEPYVTEQADATGDVVKITHIGGNIGNMEVYEYRGHEYLLYHGGSGVAMLHLESCKCKNTSND